MVAQHGVCGPNAAWTAEDWWRLGASGAQWVKLLYPDHSPQDAALARRLGLRVILRMGGEGIVHWEDVSAALTAYAGNVDTIELGNEPVPVGLIAWEHAFYLEAIALRCLTKARQQHIQLCTPGWQASLAPPTSDLGGLSQRLYTVYSLFDQIGVHTYHSDRLDDGGVKDHLAAWHAAFPMKPLVLTEYGIAHRSVSDADKARRYAAFVAALPDYFQAACMFILGGSPVWSAFNDAADGYNPQGVNGYVLSDAAVRLLGTEINRLSGAGP